MENTKEAFDSDMSSHNSQSVEAVENLKMRERCGNLIENKGSALEGRRGSWNVIQNKGSYAMKARMLLKIR